MRLADGEDVAARELLRTAKEFYQDFGEFREVVFGDWITSRIRNAG